MFSIHASAKEATKKRGKDAEGHGVFNPRLREGGDKQTEGMDNGEDIFNPRLREGGDGT